MSTSHYETTSMNVAISPTARNMWGSTSKRALLLHGLFCSSYSMRHISEGLAQHGYLVSAPDLPGHGIGPRAETYTWASMTAHVVSLLRETTYELVVGHSMGAILVLRALRDLPPAYANSDSTNSRRAEGHPRVVLLDPPLSFSEEVLEANATLFGNLVRNPPEPAFYTQMFPRWTKQDAVLQVLANELCDPNVVEMAYETRGINHLEFFESVPAHVRLVVLLGDPDTGGLCHLSDVEMFPKVETKMIKGSSHWIPYEFPEEVVKTAV